MRAECQIPDDSSLRHFLAGMAVTLAIVTAFVVGLGAGSAAASGDPVDQSTALVGVTGTLSTAGLCLSLRGSD